MKKIFIVFLTILIMVTCLALPAAAAMPSDFGDYQNLLVTNNNVIRRLISSDFSKTFYFYYAELKPDTDYTFISTKGTRNLYIGDLSYLHNGNRYLYTYPSKNLLNESGLVNQNFVKNSDGSYTLTFNSEESRRSGVCELYLPYGTYTLSLDLEYLSAFSLNVKIASYDGYPEVYRSFTTSGSYTFTTAPSYIQFYLDSGNEIGSSAVSINLMLNEGSTAIPYEPYYSDPIFIENEISVYNFHTSSNISDYNYLTNTGEFYIGINDVLSGDSSILFSRNQSSDNEFYLVEGNLTLAQISEIIDGNNYQNGYNSGYDQGYKEGEYDGLNSSKFMNSTLLTAISAPFVIVSSALDFDILGINFYNILKVLFTLLLVAFVVNKLKGRE